LASLGHEVILHNNIVVVALMHGIDPAWLLGTEIEFFRKQGVPMLGTSSHGDALCRQLEFRNYEIFRDRVWESRGGPRVVTQGQNSVELGSLVMEDFGLKYEAYDLPRDVYASESGGNWRTRLDTRGQAGLSRAELPGVRPGKIVGVLTHPIWWDFDDAQHVSMRRAG
jgi:hypothetical protein